MPGNGISFAVMSLIACTDDIGPRIAAIAPASGRINTRVVLTGERFCGADCATVTASVLLGIDPPQVQAPILEYGDDRAEIAIPAVTPVGTTSVILVVDGNSSNEAAFEVLP